MSEMLSSPTAPAWDPSTPSKVFRSELNPVDLLRRAAYMYPDKVAVVHGTRRSSYRQLAERSWRLANGLRAAGLQKGDRVAAILPNSPAMLEAHFGVPAAGGILASANGPGTREGSGRRRRTADRPGAGSGRDSQGEPPVVRIAHALAVRLRRPAHVLPRSARARLHPAASGVHRELTARARRRTGPGRSGRRIMPKLIHEFDMHAVVAPTTSAFDRSVTGGSPT
jgi:hypothetical protein